MYDYLTQFLQTADEICDAVQEVCTRAVREGVVYCELRLCPPSHINEGLTMWEVVEAALEGFSLAQDATNGVLGGGLVLCVPRDAPESEANNVLLLAAQFAGCGVLGLEFGGCGSSGSRTPTALPASSWPLRRLAPVMVGTVAAGLQFTAWVGDDGPQSLDDVGHALDLGAARICGGSALLHRNALVTRVAASGVTFEANLTGAVHGTRRRLRSYMEHPALALIALRARVALCCGDLLLSGGSQRPCDPSSEIAHLVAHCGFGWADAREVLLDGAKASFLPPHLREGLLARYEHLLDAALAAHGLRPRPAPAPAAMAAAPERIPNPRLKSPRKGGSPRGGGGAAGGRSVLDLDGGSVSGSRPGTPEPPGSPRSVYSVSAASEGGQSAASALGPPGGGGVAPQKEREPDPELPMPRTLTERKRAAAAAAAAADRAAAMSAAQPPPPPPLTPAQEAAQVAAGQMQAAMDAVFSGAAGGGAPSSNGAARPPASARFAAAKAAAAAALSDGPASPAAPAPAPAAPAAVAAAPPPLQQASAAPVAASLHSYAAVAAAPPPAAAAQRGAPGAPPGSKPAPIQVPQLQQPPGAPPAAMAQQPAWVAAAAAGGSAAPLAGTEAPKWPQRPPPTPEQKRSQETHAAEARAAAAAAPSAAAGLSNDVAAMALQNAFSRLGLQMPEPKKPTSPNPSNRRASSGFIAVCSTPLCRRGICVVDAFSQNLASTTYVLLYAGSPHPSPLRCQRRARPGGIMPAAELYEGYGRAETDLAQHSVETAGRPTPGGVKHHSRHLPPAQASAAPPRPQTSLGQRGAGAGGPSAAQQQPPRPASAMAGGRGAGAPMLQGQQRGVSPYDDAIAASRVAGAGAGQAGANALVMKREKPQRICGGWGGGGGGGRVQTSEDAKQAEGGGGGGWFGWGRGNRPRMC